MAIRRMIRGTASFASQIGMATVMAAMMTFVVHVDDVLASDGTLEISQSCATAAGCFPADAAGFPVTIGIPGSYRLTTDLFVGDPALSAIEIDAHDVHLDLNGFGVHGASGCASELSCTPAAGGGIVAAGPVGQGPLFGDRVTIRRGTVQGFGGDGIVLRDHALIEDVSVAHIGGDAIRVSSGGRIAGNRVAGFLGTGIAMGPNTLYGENSILDFASGGGSGPSIAGGTPSAVNSCYDGGCPAPSLPPPVRPRFYVTNQRFSGSNANQPGLCAAGFHFASIYELLDPTGFQYDSSLGATSADAGQGPVAGTTFRGWIRSGAASSNSAGAGGTMAANCSLWSTTTGNGMVAFLDGDWTKAGAAASPWEVTLADCLQTKPIWCVEDRR